MGNKNTNIKIEDTEFIEIPKNDNELIQFSEELIISNNKRIKNEINYFIAKRQNLLKDLSNKKNIIISNLDEETSKLNNTAKQKIQEIENETLNKLTDIKESIRNMNIKSQLKKYDPDYATELSSSTISYNSSVDGK